MAAGGKFLPKWSVLIPAVAWGLLILSTIGVSSGILTALIAIALFGAVVCAVHHAEVIALKVGEPYGTLVLALSVTTIEVALIVSMMLSGGEDTMGLPRDTIFAALMIIFNGIIGLSLLVGGRRHRVQKFNIEGMTDALGTTSVIAVLALVVPSFTTTIAGPALSSNQLAFLAVVTLVLFAGFTAFQTLLHRDYFIFDSGEAPKDSVRPDLRTVFISLALLLISLVAVVLSAKTISPTLEAALGRWGAPASVLGVVIAAIVLLPEFGAAMKAAAADRLQSSLNLAVGSALASIGLTIPVVAGIGIFMGWQLELGLGGLEIVLLSLTLFATALTLRTGQTTLQPGIMHLGLFAAYLFLCFVP